MAALTFPYCRPGFIHLDSTPLRGAYLVGGGGRGGGEAQWKYFTAFFLRVSNMKLGKMTLVLDYSPQRINRDIPALNRELLMTWRRHNECHTRTQIPESVTDVLNEPLLLNDLITSQEKPLLFYTRIGLQQVSHVVRNICYEAVPGFLPANALHEILTDSKPHALSTTIREYRDLLVKIPWQWLHLIPYLFDLPPWALIKFLNLECGRLFETGRLLNFHHFQQV